MKNDCLTVLVLGFNVIHILFLSVTNTRDKKNIEVPRDSSLIEKPAAETAPQNSELGSFNCDICSRSYKHWKSLQRHLKIHDAIYKCSKCTLIFSDEDELQRHNDAKHTIAEHLCSICGKRYNKKASLTEHLLKHGHGNSLKCPISGCQKIFTRSKRLTDHLNSHTGMKPYSCEICRKKYKSHASLKNHKATCLYGVKCVHCEKTFSSHSVLADHVNSMHSGKVLLCRCGQSFRWRSSLSRHKSIKGCWKTTQCAFSFFSIHHVIGIL